MAVVSQEIKRREPVLEGTPFGEAGPYEKLVGAIRFAVDPARPVHRPIADLDRAPRNAQGLVESLADFYLLRPIGGGSRRLLLDLPNRGRKMAISLFKRALSSLNGTLALLNADAATRVRAVATWREQALPRLFDLREVWLRVIAECREELDRPVDDES